LTDYSVLAGVPEFWAYWGFEAWEFGGMKGVSRKVTFVKDALIGEVARYYAYDYIVLVHNGKVDADLIYNTWKPKPEVMLHRFIFVEERAVEKKRIKSFLLGVKGYLEVHHYSLNGTYDKKIRDLAPLVDKAWELIQKDNTGTDGGGVIG
jgi:hypothetical protein